MAEIARTSEVGGIYTTLGPPSSLSGDTAPARDFYGIRLDEQGRCPLRRVKLPRSKHWSQVGRPGGFRHITMEEAEAMIWSLDSRLRRPDELGCRIVTGGDNAPQVGAFMRGRSPSHALNGCCRKACAIELAGNFMPFYFWTPTDDNPEDEPSSWYGVRSLGVRQPPPSAGSTSRSGSLPPLGASGSPRSSSCSCCAQDPVALVTSGSTSRRRRLTWGCR